MANFDINEVIRLMEKDLENPPEGFLDHAVAQDETGKELKPLEVLAEVKAQSKFGVRYAQGWYLRHQMTAAMEKGDIEQLLNLLDEAQDLDDQNAAAAQGSNEQAN